jgi:hypothetical protein
MYYLYFDTPTPIWVSKVDLYKERKMQQLYDLVLNRPRLKSGLIAKVHSSGLSYFSTLLTQSIYLMLAKQSIE